MRARFLPLVVSAGLALLAGCRWSASFDGDNGLLAELHTDGTGSLVGVVLQGPVRPVVIEGEEDTAPLADAPLEIRHESGPIAATATSGTDGTFLVTLAPGTYVVVAKSLSAGWPKPPPPQTLTVPANGVARARIEYDTGVRYKVEGGK